MNEKTENIGARRLYTVLEKLLEEISFEAGKRGAEAIVTIDAAYVDARLARAREERGSGALRSLSFVQQAGAAQAALPGTGCQQRHAAAPAASHR